MKNDLIIMNGISSSWDEAITGFDALWPTIPAQYLQQTAEGGRLPGEIHRQYPDKGTETQQDLRPAGDQRVKFFRCKEKYQQHQQGV